MAKLHFFYSVMNAGKSTHLLQAAHNYEVTGWNVLLVTSAIDDRAGVGKISSRIGLSKDARAISSLENLYDIFVEATKKQRVDVVLMDEIQFMSKEHIEQASDIVDKYGIPVMAYGLKNNVLGELFSDSVATMLALADKINEIKQVCHCGDKATMILRYNKDGSVSKSGPVVEIGGEGRYVSVCRKHFKSGTIGPVALANIQKPTSDPKPNKTLIARIGDFFMRPIGRDA